MSLVIAILTSCPIDTPKDPAAFDRVFTEPSSRYYAETWPLLRTGFASLTAENTRYTADSPTKAKTIRDSALSSPKIAVTRLNLNNPTRPQLSPPTITRTSAVQSIALN